MKAKTVYQRMSETVTLNLISRVLAVLVGIGHGREKAISRTKLLVMLQDRGCYTSERAVRLAIHALRRDGCLICSAPGEDGGYYLAATHDEFLDFCNRELHPKAMDLLETERAMKASAKRIWGDAVQLALIN